MRTAYCLRLFLLFILASTSFSMDAQQFCGMQNLGHAANCSCGLYAIEEDQFSFVSPPSNFQFGGERTVIVNVNYSGFPANAEAAFDYAVDVWASVLSSNVPIVIDANWTSIGGGVLGFAGATTYRRNFTGAPMSGTWYPIALANKLHGSDLEPSQTDVECTFSSDFSWYFGTDGNCPGGQYDFVTVVLHELCHGLGCIGSADVNGALGSIGFSGDAVIYDEFTEDNAGTDLTSMPNNSATLGTALTSNNVYWNGALGLDGNSGVRPRLYAPGSWDGGSSYSHLNDATYPAGNVNSLMTPFLGSAEAIHDPGPIMAGMFEDMGWTFNSCEISNVTIGTQTSCNPATNQYTQEVIVTYDDPPADGSLTVNGFVFTITSSPQTCVLTLASNGLTLDCNVSFTEASACLFSIDDAWLAPTACCDNLRLVSVNSASDQIQIKNFGTCPVLTGTFQLCNDGACATISTMTLISGNIFLSANATLTVQWNAFAGANSSGNLSLHEPGALLGDATKILDFMQWGMTGQGEESTADGAGKWVAGTFITDLPPFNFTGSGINYGVAFWDGVTPPCSIQSLTTGTQSPCNEPDNTYTQQVIVNFISPPASGQLSVHGQLFSVASSPQTVTLTGLDSDGLPMNITAFFLLCECPGDFNGDNQTDILDFLLFLADYGCTSSCVADLTGDDFTDIGDFLILSSLFATQCP